jgi:iron-sulfur cluster assembly protein
MKIEIDFKVTESAIKEFKRALSEAAEPTDLVRISIQGGGCSGFKYGLFFVDKDDFDEGRDVAEDYDGLKVVVDKKSAFLLDGTTIDWSDGPESGFKFDNPNAKKGCGCSKGSCS